jgi:hypothetical protein
MTRAGRTACTDRWRKAITRSLPLIALAALISCATARTPELAGPATGREPASSWIRNCTLPEPGQDRLYRVRPQEDRDPNAFKLTRLSDQGGKRRLEIALPVEYLPEDSPGVTTGGDADQFAADFADFMKSSRAREMRTRAEECLKQASPYLRSPDGDQLTLRLAEPDEKRKFGPLPIA